MPRHSHRSVVAGGMVVNQIKLVILKTFMCDLIVYSAGGKVGEMSQLWMVLEMSYLLNISSRVICIVYSVLQIATLGGK